MKKQKQKLSKQEISQKNPKPKKINIQLAKKTYFKKFISSEENKNFSPGEKFTGLNNRLNFLGILEGGFYSDGYNYIEITPLIPLISLKLKKKASQYFFG